MISKIEKHDGCTFVIVSDAGISHRVNSIPNQDAADLVFINGDYALAVSDGVGSCKRAEIGAQAAVGAVKKAFISLQGNSVPSDLFEISHMIINEWKQLLAGESLDDCCATLKAAMKLGSRLLMFSVGDGILAFSSGGTGCCAPVDNLLFANQTRCLSKETKPEELWVSVFRLEHDIPYAVFACSDGVSNGILEGRELDLVKEIETGITASALRDELEALLVDISEYSSDDRTVGVVKYERENAESDG